MWALSGGSLCSAWPTCTIQQPGAPYDISGMWSALMHKELVMSCAEACRVHVSLEDCHSWSVRGC